MLEVAVLYGCDLSQVFTPIILRLYQPHSLCEKGATKAAAKAALYVFLLTPLREGQPDRVWQPEVTPMHFYSRPCTRGNCGSRFVSAPVTYFYSRPYTRGDFRRIVILALEHLISTRAPTRGATQRTRGMVYLYDISTRAPTRGATGNVDHAAAESTISTPAPTRGATAIFHKTTS